MRVWQRQLGRVVGLLALAPAACMSVVAQQASSAVEATTVPSLGLAAVAYDQAGNLYIAAARDHIVRKVDVLGLITNVAGTGEQGFGGDGGSATSALLDSPSGVAVDSNGNIYIADTRNHRIRRVTNGVITTVAGTGIAGSAGDGAAAASAQLNVPVGLSVDVNGALYIADSGNHRIRKLNGGVLTTVAGTGEQGYAGDGAAAMSALLDTPTGVAVDPTVAGRFYIADRHNNRVRQVAADGTITTMVGTVTANSAPIASLAGPRGIAVAQGGSLYVADTDNQRILTIAGGSVSTIAGTGEQGFSGDIGTAASAVLDTPSSITIGPAGLLALADSHNQRARSIANANINTVAGIAPDFTEGLLLNGPTTGVYGTAPGQLTAAFSNNGLQATGTATLYQDGAVFARQALAGNRASFDLTGIAGGLHTFAVAYAGDAANASASSGVYLMNIGTAAQTITFPALQSPVTYSSGLTATLAATASSGLPVAYTVTGPAAISGTTLTYTGSGNVVVTATQAGSANYSPASVQQTIVVTPATLVIANLSPNSVPLGTSGAVVIVTGSGYTRSSVVQWNGSTLPTAFVSGTQLTASLPQLTSPGPQTLSIFDSATQQRSANATFTVTAPAANASLSVPNTSRSGQQPSLNLQLQSAYPVALSGVLTLSFTPDGGLSVDDPNIQFSTGGRSMTFTVPANSTTVPAVAFQTGTVAGTITVTLNLTAAGIDVTPATARVATVVVARQSPAATVSFTQTGSVLTLTVRGYSNTRDMSQANFTFTPAPGTDLATRTINLPVADIFSTWFSTAASAAQGSIFTYTQTFNLSDSSSVVQSVGVDLTNSTGTGSATPVP